MDKKILGACMACGRYDDLKNDLQFFLTHRCASCRKAFTPHKKYGSLFTNSIIAMTQRELAEVKRQLYQTEKLLSELDKRKNEFITRAMEEANTMMQEVEQQLGRPLKEVRAANIELKQKLKTFMETSGQNEMRIRDMLVTVKEEVVNAGNRPLWTQIVNKMGDLLKWTEEELQTFVRANYSLPQYGKNLYTQFLPPGKRNKPAYFQLEIDNNRHARIKDIEKEWINSGDAVCRVNDCGEIFIITGEFIHKNGLAKMIQLQSTTKRSLSISDVEQTGNRSHVMVEGKFAFDPNTVRAFLADRFPDREVGDVLPLSMHKIAVELLPEGETNPGTVVLDFFGRIIDIVDSLMSLEQARNQVINSLPENVVARNQGDTPDNVDDLYLKWERNQPAQGGPGAFGNGAEEGIMAPSGNSPLIQTSGDCQSCGRSKIGSIGELCIFCEIEHHGLPN